MESFSLIESALAQGDLPALVRRLEAQGLAQAEIYDRFHRFRLRLLEEGRDPEAARLADVLDRIVGWCSPAERLFPAPLSSAQLEAYYRAAPPPPAGGAPLDPAAMRALYDRLMRFEIEYPEMRRELLPFGVARHTRAAPGRGFVIYSALDESHADAAIEEQIAFYKSQSMTFEWKVYDHDTPADLLQRLQRRGAEVDEPEAILALDLQRPPDSLLEPLQADVRPITSRKGLADVIAVEQQVWGGDFDWIYARLGGHLEIPDYLNIYVAYVQGVPACAAWVYFHPNALFGDLWAGSTLPAYRQQGLYTALLRARVQEALRRGYRFLTVDAGPMSRPILEKHGFQLIATAHACEWRFEGRES